MFDYQTELVISRMERERKLKALVLAAAAGRRSGLRAGLAAALTRLALAVHREAAVGAVQRPQAGATGCEPEREAISA
jgi:hypothetical protein